MEKNTKDVVEHSRKGDYMEGIYLYKEKIEEIKEMINELGVSL